MELDARSLLSSLQNISFTNKVVSLCSQKEKRNENVVFFRLLGTFPSTFSLPGISLPPSQVVSLTPRAGEVYASSPRPLFSAKPARLLSQRPFLSPGPNLSQGHFTSRSLFLLSTPLTLPSILSYVLEI